FSFTQDISVIDLPPLFTIFLSQDFTAKMGGYLSADWSHMILRTRYGTKVTIRVEPIFHNHVEPYTASPINGNYTIHDPEEEVVDHKPTTLVEEVPDTMLDEVSVDHQYDPYAEALAEEEVGLLLLEEMGLGTYCIHEEGAIIPQLVKTQNNSEGLWKLFFDGSRSKNGAGVGVMLISPEGDKYFSSF
ncbi:hypothetical protein KI387_038834, partial [Taxus chinensis]